MCFAFVDNTDVVHTETIVNQTGEDVLENIQEVFDTWKGVLRATGGAIVPEQSYWYLINFMWTGRKWEYRNLEGLRGSIDIRNVEGNRREILE